MIFRLCGLVAGAALGAVALLALFPLASSLPSTQMAPDKLGLAFLLVFALALQWAPLWKRLIASRDGATWVLLCAFFVLFQIADKAGPREGFSLRFGWAPDDPVVLSYAARIAMGGALASLPLWLRRGGVERYFVLSLALVGVFGLGMFRFLANYYSVGAADAVLAPAPMVSLIEQMAAYAALALCCRAAVEDERLRLWVLRAVPLVLLLVLARHQFQPIPVPTDE